jgi:enoyl-CoA hydratase/carnithine racemase
MDAVEVVDLSREDPPPLDSGVSRVVVGIGDTPSAGCDVVVPPGDDALDAITATVARHPIASVAFVQVLRHSLDRSVDDGLLHESAVYSSLQAGPEFTAWRAATPVKREPETVDAVELRRDGDALFVTLRRPHVRNALNTMMRDQLVDAFDLVALDDSISEVHLVGEGVDFCAGGDLDEFGTFPDPATAHLVRVEQSVGRRIAAVAPRVTAHLHGACLGSGIELPAFAGTVVADPTTSIGLPELSLGLIPGAGGTVSLPRRIGRHRTAWLGLTGRRIDAATAYEWGLVDGISTQSARPSDS